MKNTTKLKTIAQRREAVLAPGTPNALFARVIEDLGFEVVYVTGAGIANMGFGVPDVGLTTLTEVANCVSAIADSVSLPIIADGDTGFGNAVNMYRTVRVFERAGASGIQIEDQVFPKKCGHFNGKGVVPLDEAVQKVKAAVDARQDQDFQIIARTDSRASDGIDHAIERALAFAEAGADITFVEAPVSAEEMKRIPADIGVPQVANIVYGGMTPALDQNTLAEMNFGLVWYANAALQASLKTVYEVLGSLKEVGSLENVADRLVSFEHRQRAVNKDFWDELETRYKSS